MKQTNTLTRFIIASLFFSLVTCQLLNAQEGARQALEAKPTVQLSTEQLKAVAGVFQNPGNAEMYIQFTTAENAIVGKLLWNNNQIRFTPESDLIFFSKNANEGNPLRITFKKDSTGAITFLSVGNNDLWKRIANYKPVVKIEMAHTPEQLKLFEGVFQMQNGRQQFIQFYVKDNQLVLKQHWDGTEVPLVPESELSFFSKELLLFSVAFTKDKDGNIMQTLVSKRDTWNKLAPVHPTTEQLKIFEGKYQSKDDEDNYLQLIARDNKLVLKQLWDKKEIILQPKTDIYFYNDEQSYPLGFIKDKDGAYTQLKVLGIDLFTKVKD